VRKVPFLGVVVGKGRVEMEEDKVEGVLKWPTPQCVRDVRKFLGLANYYRCFIKDFAKMALSMNQLTRKDEKWKWEEEQQTVFKQLKCHEPTRPYRGIIRDVLGGRGCSENCRNRRRWTGLSL